MIAELLYLTGYLLQIVAYALIVQKVSRKRTVLGLSCDLVAYSWLWLTANALCGGLYLFSQPVSLQYSQRYPVYPTYQISLFTFLLDFFGVLVTSALALQTLHKFRLSRRANEALSLPFYFLMTLMGLGLVWLLWAYIRGRATINELDLANYGWLLSYVSFSFRLLPQCSVNWFFSRYNVLHKHFLSMHACSLLLLTSSLTLFRLNGKQWFELPVNYVSPESLLLNWLALAIFACQRHIYSSSQTPLPR